MKGSLLVQVPGLTLRDSMEWVETASLGANFIAGTPKKQHSFND